MIQEGNVGTSKKAAYLLSESLTSYFLSRFYGLVADAKVRVFFDPGEALLCELFGDCLL